MPLIHIIEDDEPHVLLLKYNLEAAGYEVEAFGSGEEGCDGAIQTRPDLIILDLGLPGFLSGHDVCRRIRSNPETAHVPILIYTACAEPKESLQSFSLGADDFITKPFEMEVLIARVKAILKRGRVVEASTLEYAGIVMDCDRRRVEFDGRKITLSAVQFRILRMFLSHPQIVFSRERILKLCWKDGTDLEDRTVDVHIGRLRQALTPGRKKSADVSSNSLIKTVREEGYKLDVET